MFWALRQPCLCHAFAHDRLRSMQRRFRAEENSDVCLRFTAEEDEDKDEDEDED